MIQRDPDGAPRVRALILVPTRELSEQVRDYLRSLTLYCTAEVNCVMLSADAPLSSQKCVNYYFLNIILCSF